MSNSSVANSDSIWSPDSLEPMVISGLWIILWLFLSLHLSLAFIYTFFIFAFTAQFTGMRLFFAQCKRALPFIVYEIDYLDSSSLVGSHICLSAIDSICDRPSVLTFDTSSLKNPYKTVWRALMNQTSRLLHSSNFMQIPDRPTADDERLLKIYASLGSYGVSHKYISPAEWDKKKNDLDSLLRGKKDYFEWLSAHN